MTSDGRPWQIVQFDKVGLTLNLRAHDAEIVAALLLETGSIRLVWRTVDGDYQALETHPESKAMLLSRGPVLATNISGIYLGAFEGGGPQVIWDYLGQEDRHLFRVVGPQRLVRPDWGVIVLPNVGEALLLIGRGSAEQAVLTVESRSMAEALS